MSAIARFLLEQGYRVSGSDRALSSLAAYLVNEGAIVSVGHAAKNVVGADWVVRSSAIPDDNPEVLAAQAAGIPVYNRADFLGKMMAPPEKDGIAIAGTHGKTTTTAMIAWTLDQLGAEPSFIIGGVSQNFGVNARFGKGRAFIIEADEYDRMFLGLKPRYAIVTNIEHDHPDIYPTQAEFFAAFQEFAGLIPENGALIFSAEDPGALRLANQVQNMGKRLIGYQITEEQKPDSFEWIQAQNVAPNKFGGFSFTASTHLLTERNSISEIQLQVPGLHNVRRLCIFVNGDLYGARAVGSRNPCCHTACCLNRKCEVSAEAGAVIAHH